MRSQRSIYSLNILLWNTGLIIPGGAVGLWDCAELRKLSVTSLDSALLKIISSLITGVQCAPGGAIVSHTWLSNFLLPRKSYLTISKCRIISPSLQMKVMRLFSFNKILLNKIGSSSEQLQLSICWSVLLNQFPTSMCDNIDNREQYSIEFLILEQIFV